MCGDKSARMIIKTGSGVPTIPVSADHRNGDWIATDIYEGESYMDTDTGIVYTRNGSSIEAVGGGGGGVQPKVWSVQIGQSGTSAPTIVGLINTLDVTITPSYGVAGGYVLNGFDSKLTGLWKLEYSINDIDYTSTHSFLIGAPTSSQLTIATYIGGVQSNGVLPSSPSYKSTITITKYD